MRGLIPVGGCLQSLSCKQGRNLAYDSGDGEIVLTVGRSDGEAAYAQALPAAHNAFVYVYRGALDIGGRAVPRQRMAILANDAASDGVRLAVSDDAGQFNVGRHALCWVHAERLVHKLETFTDDKRAAQQRIRSLIWWFYDDLKAYRRDPTLQRKAALRARFDRIFRRRTGFATLDRLLARLLANKNELLMVLDHPEIPLHTNGSENDIRCQVIKRKISGGTRSDNGRDARDTFLSLLKTCDKLGIRFWEYLGDRLAITGAKAVPHLPLIVAQPARPV